MFKEILNTAKNSLSGKKLFQKFSLFTLCFTLGVILWGAWVRFSHSGDGCGQSWPLCKQELLPKQTSALIEWFHRATSGLSLLLVVALLVLAFRLYPKKHLIRKCSLTACVLIFVEALIGAVLVMASLTGSDNSSLRVMVLGLHLLNSLFLIGSLVFCWQGALASKVSFKKPLFYFLILFPILALTGSIASLSNTLFPADSLSQALAFDLQPEHITLKLRPLHPLLAVLFVLTLAGTFQLQKGKELALPALIALFTLLFGFAALLSLSPVWMKLSHLFIAYVLWIVLVKHSFAFK